jgi:hypothetical protein
MASLSPLFQTRSQAAAPGAARRLPGLRRGRPEAPGRAVMPRGSLQRGFLHTPEGGGFYTHIRGKTGKNSGPAWSAVPASGPGSAASTLPDTVACGELRPLRDPASASNTPADPDAGEVFSGAAACNPPEVERLPSPRAATSAAARRMSPPRRPAARSGAQRRASLKPRKRPYAAHHHGDDPGEIFT